MLTTEDVVFKALADGNRRRMLDVIQKQPGITVGELCARFPMSRIGAMKHLKLLEQGQLVLSEEDGSARRLYINAVPIMRIQERWTSQFGANVARGLNVFKRELEAKRRKR